MSESRSSHGKLERLYVYAPPELAARLRELANEQDRPLTAQVRWLLERALALTQAAT